MVDKQQYQDGRFPIRELSARTQVNTVTIRAWERRYGLLKPARTNKGHRLYSDNDVATIKKILDLVARGVPLGKVKPLLQTDSSHDLDSDQIEDWAESVSRMLVAAEMFSSSKLEHLMSDFFSQFPARVCLQRLIEPTFAALANLRDSGAVYNFAESELLRYVTLRLSAKVSKEQRGQPLVLLRGKQTPVWRLATVAMELADSQYTVTLLSNEFAVDPTVIVAGELKESTVIYFQEGVWNKQEVDIISAALASNKNLLLCGTAPVLAKIDQEKRVFSSLENAAMFLLDAENIQNRKQG